MRVCEQENNFRQRANEYALMVRVNWYADFRESGQTWPRMARRMALEAVWRLLRPIGVIPDPAFFSVIQTRFSEFLDLVF